MDSYFNMHLVTTSRLPGIPDIKPLFLWLWAIWEHTLLFPYFRVKIMWMCRLVEAYTGSLHRSSNK